MDNEDLFISLYTDFTPTAEYLQADSEHRNFLPEAMIISGLAFALAAFAKGFLGHLGKTAADVSVKQATSLFKKSEEAGERDVMLEGLDIIGPYLKHLPDMTTQQRLVYRDAIATALSGRGYPKDVAEQTADDLMTSLTAAGTA